VPMSPTFRSTKGGLQDWRRDRRGSRVRVSYRIAARASSLRMDLSISARLDLPISLSNSFCMRSRAR
jgi:hypothetical protein